MRPTVKKKYYKITKPLKFFRQQNDNSKQKFRAYQVIMKQTQGSTYENLDSANCILEGGHKILVTFAFIICRLLVQIFAHYFENDIFRP